MCTRSRRLLTMTLAGMVSLTAPVVAQHTAEPIAEPAPFEATWTIVQVELSEAWGRDGLDPLHEIGGEMRLELLGSTDPRFEGDAVNAYNSDRYRSTDLQVHHSQLQVTTDEGSWQETPAAMLAYPDLRPATRTSVLYGAGAYQELTAVAQLTWDPRARTLHADGYIVAGGFPPRPGEATRPEAIDR